MILDILGNVFLNKNSKIVNTNSHTFFFIFLLFFNLAVYWLCIESSHNHTTIYNKCKKKTRKWNQGQTYAYNFFFFLTSFIRWKTFIMAFGVHSISISFNSQIRNRINEKSFWNCASPSPKNEKLKKSQNSCFGCLYTSEKKQKAHEKNR